MAVPCGAAALHCALRAPCRLRALRWVAWMKPGARQRPGAIRDGRAVRRGRPALRASRSMQATGAHISNRPLCDARHARRRRRGAKLLSGEAPEPPVGRRPRSDKGQGCTMRIAHRNAGGSPRKSGSPLAGAAHAPGLPPERAPLSRVSPSCPRLSRASTSFRASGKPWMAGTSPAMTSWMASGPSAARRVLTLFRTLRVAVACPARQAYHGVAPRMRGACSHTRGDPGAER
jgi:hypothetical protein